jgi:hypothetical protein
MERLNIDDRVLFKGKEAIVADRLGDTYLLWDKSGVKEFKIPKSYKSEWIHRSELKKIRQ